MKGIFLVLLIIMSIGCQSSNENKAQTIKTSYPLTGSTDSSLVISVDEARKNGVLNNLPLLKVGDTSSEVVQKLGYKPDLYYIAPNKTLNLKPHHLIMSYFFKPPSSEQDLLAVEEQSVIFIFSIDDKLKSIIFSPAIQGISGISLPILR